MLSFFSFHHHDFFAFLIQNNQSVVLVFPGHLCIVYPNLSFAQLRYTDALVILFVGSANNDLLSIFVDTDVVYFFRVRQVADTPTEMFRVIGAE